jgi:hypothetical protein
LIDGRVKRSIGSGVGPAGGKARGSREDTGSAQAEEEEVNADGLPGTLAGIENWLDDKMEALLDKELPQWDVLMSEELEPPLKKILE